MTVCVSYARRQCVTLEASGVSLMEVFAFDVDASAMAEAMSAEVLKCVAHHVFNTALGNLGGW